METRTRTVYRFGPFEVDTAAGELLRQGKQIGLQEQPFRLLVILLERSGEVVTRAEIQSRIWEDITFGDFDSSLRVAVGKLRAALGDDAANPRYVETIPKRGYRFLGPAIVEPSTLEAETQSTAPVASPVRTGIPVSCETAPIQRSLRSKWALAGAAVALACLTIAASLFLSSRKSVLDERDTLVLADFTNTTGDPVFDETLRQATAIELEQSPFLSLVSDGRIRHTLRLMGQPPDARLTPEVARELCERTGSAAVLDGSIQSLGSQYVIGLRVRSCATGDVLVEEQAQAARKEDVLAALSGMAGKFRVRLGESLTTVQQHNAPLAEATTPSIDALKAYTAGLKIALASGAADALPSFKRAIEIDPEFAMAYSVLGRLYGDLGESELSAKSSTRAYELRGRASDEERFWIAASFEKQVTGNLQKAEETCNLWAQAYPRAVAPHGFLSGNISLVRGDYEKAIEEARTAIEIDPDFAIGYGNLVVSDLALGRVDDAESALGRASARKLEIPDFVIQSYMIAFLKGDKNVMDREAAKGLRDPAEKEWMANSEGFVLAYAGRLRDAETMSRLAEDLARQADRRETEALYRTDAAVREALFGRSQAARRSVAVALQLSRSRDVEYGAALALALAGDSLRPQGLADDLLRRFPEDTKVGFGFMPTLRALLALNHNAPAAAVEELKSALPYENGVRSAGPGILIGAGTLYPAYVRGQAYLAMHRGREAAQEFQKILDRRGIVLSDPIGALAHLQIARAYAAAGDKEQARAAYRDFLTLCKDADPDIPLLKNARTEYSNLR